MLKNYLKIALRNIKRHKGYSFINIIGLAIGMACCILIVNYILYELSYDKYHEKSDQIYRISMDIDFGGKGGKLAASNHPVGQYLAETYPDVINSVKFRRYMYRTLVEYKEKKFFENRIFYTENSVFDVFSFPMVIGNPESALKNPHSVVLTEHIAKKYFGNDYPIGKVIRFDNSVDYTVTGVLEDVLPNSHLRYDILCSFESFYARDPAQRQLWIKDWNNYTFLLLREGADPVELEKRFPEMVEKKFGRIIKIAGAKIDYFLMPLTDIHLYSDLEGEISATGGIDYIYAFAAIAFFILLIACINFMNLATARSANRAKEVGMRKVLGANRRKLIFQFLGESLFLSFFAFILALAFSELALPLIRSLSGAEMNLSFMQKPWLVAAAVGFIVFVGILAGSYPATYLASFKPVKVLQGRLKTGLANFHFRSILVVVQFTISIVLIIGTFIIFKQINYMKNEKLGFNEEHVVLLQILDNSMLRSIETFKVELKRHPGIINVSVSSHIPSLGARHNAFLPEGFATQESQMMGKWSVDEDLIPTLGMEIVQGRNFSLGMGTDMKNSILINETAANQIGWDNPIGKTISEMKEGLVTKTVIGVVRDFHISSLQNALEPILFEYAPSDYAYISVRLYPGKIKETLSFLETKWKEFDPTGTFDYEFLDVAFNGQYGSEERLNNIFTYFTMIAIFIACLGLFGLASFTAEQRTKEIGIRKILGATELGIVILLSKEFTKWVGIAMILAWPIAYFVMNRWLQDFAYRTSISAWSFLFSAFVSLVIALITVGFQAVKAARANPVKSLRYE